MKIKKMLSLIAAAAISASAFAGLAVTASAAATSSDYAEWTVIGTSRRSVDSLYDNEKHSNTLSAQPKFAFDGTKFGECQKYKAAEDYTFTPYSGSSMTISAAPTDQMYAIKLGKSGSGISISGLLPEGCDYSAYDLKVVYSLRYTGTQGLTVTYADGTEYKDTHDNGTAERYTVKEFNKEGLTSNTVTLTRSNSEVELLYVGVKYTAKESGTDPDPTDEPQQTEDPQPTEDPIVETEDWINNAKGTDGITVTKDAEDAYVLTYAKDVAPGKGFSYDLLKNMTNKPSDIATADGIITVNFETYVDSISGDFTYEINGDTTVDGWGGGSSAMYARLAGNSGWNTMRYLAGSQSTLYDFYRDANKVIGSWVPVTFTLNLKTKTVEISYNNDNQSSAGSANAAWVKTPNGKLYLNVQPSMSANTLADTVIKVRNISAAYTEAPIPVPATASVSEVQTFTDQAKGAFATAFKLTVNPNDNVVKTLVFDGQEYTLEPEISGPTEAVYAVIYQNKAVEAPVVTVK